ncbi:unnamed protein product [Linum trigynum]|uniref:Uncharacterized protein n=1 Tax=Linum trigynum TaxID=586398 RepID=A0AAV2CNR7_9ROSI
MGLIRKAGGVAPLKKRARTTDTDEKRTIPESKSIAAASASLAAIWRSYERTEGRLEALSRSLGYVCPIGPFRRAVVYPSPAALVATHDSVSEMERALEHMERRLEALCRINGCARPVAPRG